MPWTTENPPRPAKNWPGPQKSACVRAANATLADGGSDQEAIRACIGAAKRVRESSSASPKGERSMRVVDLFATDRVLAGESVRILPLRPDGYWRGGMLNPPITPEIIAQLAGNFDQRGEQGQYQTNIPLNIEHDDREGKIGTIEGVSQEADGLYAQLALTEKGRELLGDDAFDYLSPEIVWSFPDPKTGGDSGPTLVGCAVTNYPYFGDETAMFTQEAGDQWYGDTPSSEVGGLVDRIVAGFQDMLDSALRGSQSGGQEQPTGGNAMSGTEGDAGQGLQIPEGFSQRMQELEAAVETFAVQVEERDARIADQAGVIEVQRGRIDSLEQTNLRARFSRQADGLPYVGAESETLVDELMWLHGADETEGRDHFEYFSALLRTHNDAMSQSGAFQEAGQAGHREGGTAMQTFSTLVAEEASRQGLTVVEGDENWARLAMEVASDQRELYQQYMVEVRGQAQQ